MLPEHCRAAPIRMFEEIESFCKEVRSGVAPVYGHSLRENVIGVVKCSFPSFFQCMGTQSIERMVDRFMRDHQAERPHFHEIASEIVCFAQQCEAMPRPLLCLLEYEWALLAAEIDPRSVRSPDGTRLSVGDPFAEQLQVNPTLRVVAVPFDAHHFSQDDLGVQDAQQHVYGIYRTSHHVVMTQEFGFLDCLFIDAIQKRRRIVRDGLDGTFPDGDANEAATKWLGRALKNELVQAAY